MSNNLRYHEAFGTTTKALRGLGVFNGFVGRDAEFYIVPHLLQETQIPEFKTSYEKYKKHFSTIVKLLKHSKKHGDTLYREASKKFVFHEIAHVGLGYSKTGKKGSGIGPGLANMLTVTASEIVQAGIEDPEIFELIGLLQEKIGADRISDMLISILADDFLKYTGNVAKKLKLSINDYEYQGTTYQVPHYQSEPVIFVPEEFLIALPIAIDRDDISRVCAHNEALRNRVNEIISNSMKSGAKITKHDLKMLILREPKLAKEFVDLIKEKVTDSYDFEEDPQGDLIWKDLAEDFTANHPLSINKKSLPFDIVKTICAKYLDLIENNGLFKFFHNADGSHKNEAFAQMLFFAIAQSYCEANNLDLSPESDAGRGPVDFKLSRGGDAKVNVELKLSTNRLLHGYETQLPIYNKAEKTVNSIYLVILLYEKDLKKLDAVYAYKNKKEIAGEKLPEIIVVDATMKKSASKS